MSYIINYELNKTKKPTGIDVSMPIGYDKKELES